MIRHLLRLVWNRKRQNLLVTVELLLSFAMLFGVVFTAGALYYNWRQPLGFDTGQVVSVILRYPDSGPVPPGATDQHLTNRARAAETLQQVVAAVNDLPEVERAATSWPSVFYTRGGWSTELGDDRFRTFTAGHMLSDEARDVLGIKVIAGRWFTRDDDGAAVQPILINARLARELFGDTSPLDRELPPRDNNVLPQRVIGVVDDFRHEGELSFPGNAALFRLSPAEHATPVLANALLVRTRPGTSAQFEETLARTLEATAADWTFDIRSMNTRRQEAFQKTLAPIAIVTILAIFVLLMVALGLTGVVWQSVTTRVQEFGLRRAKGATAGAIQRQVITELFVLATAAVAIGATIAVQFPPLALLAPPRVKFLSVAASVTVIYLLTLLCAWYPSRLATRIQPADALHYE
jgi:putative ABC transport system permease protein